MSMLIFGFPEDIHSQAVSWALTNAGAAVELLDVSSFPCSRRISLSPTGPQRNLRWSASPQSAAGAVDCAKVDLVWCRRMNTRLLDLRGLHVDDRRVALNESRAFIRGLWQSVSPDAVWVNPLSAQETSLSKAHQLWQAQQVGFAVPPTLMSNDPDAVRQFCREHSKVIMKPFFQETWSEDAKEYVQLSCLIGEQHLRDDRAIELCPAIYQQYCEKAHELRVVVMGDDLISARIDSQNCEASRIDWRSDRLGQAQISAEELTADQRTMILTLMKRLGLVFGSLDLIVQPNGEMVFLEVNEQGQFLWLEDRCPQLDLLGRVSRFFAGHLGISADAWPSLADFRAANSVDHEQASARSLESRISATSDVLEMA